MSPSLLFDVLRGTHPERWTPDALAPLAAAAGDHGLIAFIEHALRAQNISAPAEFKESAQELVLNTRVQLAAAAEVSAAFEAAKVRAVVAKGVAAALNVYDDPSLRTFGDIDVLILPDALKAASDVLRDLDFTLVESSLKNPIECSFRRERLPGFPVEVDLHWAFTSDQTLQAPVHVPLNEVIERSRIVKKTRIPELEDTVLLGAANLARKSSQPLMLLVDFARFWASGFDTKKVIERAPAWHVKTATWLGFALAREHLGATVTDEFLNALAPEKARQTRLMGLMTPELLWNTEKHLDRAYMTRFKLACLDSRQDELRALAALPSGLLRRLGISRTLSQKVLGDRSVG